MIIFLSTLTAFFFGFLVTPIVIFFFRKNNLLDAPGGRKIHKGLTPSMGGIGIMLATFIGLATWLSLDQMAYTRFFLIAMGIMFTLGLRDDLVELTALQKLLGQCIAAFLVIGMADIRITSFYGFAGIYEIPLILSYFLTFFTIVVLTNAFNLIDGLDGLAGTLSTITLTFLGWWFITAGLLPYGIIAFTMVGAILSFLLYNWHPAKIFMGDTGSLSIGFVLSVLVILFIDRNGTMGEMASGFKFNAPIASGVAVLIVPIYDTARIFTKRAMKGKSPLSPDKSHVHHFLLRMGLSHDKVAYVLGAVKLFFLGLIFLGASYNDNVMLPVVLITALSLGYLLDKVTLQKVIKINKSQPTVLSSRVTKKAYKKPNLSKDVLDRETLNMN
jgi:UDP-GlcNAc:undecaprenyl-phosphate/decaprenyl-phosphate GlcNAc-1-phosphate transferase